ncbi:hypothetical protein SLE2022_243790 [Rubroshorea leprosula]
MPYMRLRSQIVIDLGERIKLVNLIGDETNEWKLDCIEQSINSTEASAIKSIPIPVQVEDEKMIWPLCKNGEYFVKIGYHIWHSKVVQIMNNRPSSSHIANEEVWKILRNIFTAPEVVSFIWKVLTNGLLVMNLCRRKVVDSLLCPICWRQEETVEHLLVFVGMGQRGLIWRPP